MKAYKGFNKDMTCRDFQFEEGKAYEHEGNVKVCESGFHACERPLDCFDYYNPSSSVYHEVEVDGDISKSDGNTKIAAKKIKIGARLDVAGLVQAQFEYVKEHTTTEHTDPKTANAGYRGAANAGDRGAANAGDRGAANAGDCGAANAGDYGAANAGDYGAANAGYRGAANAGDRGAANAGNYGAANAGNYGAAISRGSASVGSGGVAVARGDEQNQNKVKGGIGAILVIALEQKDAEDIIEWKAVVVDGVKIKADTWYCLKNGEFAEVKECE